MSDLASYGKILKFRQRERRRARHHAIHIEAPVRETVLLKALERFSQRGDFVRKPGLRNLVGRKLARQRVARQQPLRGIRQRLARSIEPASIWRDEPITLGKFGGHREPGSA